MTYDPEPYRTAVPPGDGMIVHRDLLDMATAARDIRRGIGQCRRIRLSKTHERSPASRGKGKYPVTARDHLRAAWTALHRADELRAGPNRDHYLSQASDHLESAGRHDLAAEAEAMMCNGGGDIAKLQAAIDGALRSLPDREFAEAAE